MGIVRINPSNLIIIVLSVLVLGLLFQLNSFNTKTSRLERELDYSRKEYERLNKTIDATLEGVPGKIDLKLLTEIADSYGEAREQVFPIAITCSTELGEKEFTELNELGIGFVKINGTNVSEGGEYLATGTFPSIIKASEKDYLSSIKYGPDLPYYSSGEILLSAFADFPEDADFAVQPESPTEGDLVEISVTNKHETKNMALTLNLYVDEETRSNLIFSSAEGIEGYRPPYIILKPGATYTVQIPFKIPGEYFISPGNLSFTVNASGK